MRTSHTSIERQIKDRCNTITDELLFSSVHFAAYLMDIAEGVSKRYKRPVKIQLQWAPEEQVIAFTDNRKIVINGANVIAEAFSSRADKADSLVGLLAHELGHVNYTCFSMAQAYFLSMETGTIKPAVTGLTKAEKQAKLALQQYFQEKNHAAMAVIKKTAHTLWNIIEDSYVEARISHDFPGRFAYAIALNRKEMFNQSLTLEEQMQHGLPNLIIMQNLLLQYCLHGQVKNPEGLTGELWDKLVSCVPDIDEAKYDDEAKMRLKAASKILLKLWPYVEEAIIAFEPQLEKQRSSSVDGNHVGDSSNDEVNTEIIEAAIKEFMKGLQPMSMEPNGLNAGVGLDDTLNALTADGVLEQAGNPMRIPLKHTDAVEVGEGQTVTYNHYVAQSSYGSSAHEITKMLSNIATDMVHYEHETELAETLQSESDRIDYGNAHLGIDIQINRMVNVPDELIRQYQMIAPGLRSIAEQTARQVKKALPQNNGGAKQCYMGKRLIPRTLSRQDGKYFRQDKLPLELAKLAVALVVDESGSMSGDRIVSARAASIIVYQFCQLMAMPVMVVGHTAEYKTVQLYAYTEFDSLDQKDCYRLMDIQSRDSNRDGAALRYAAQRLINRPEDKKILIILSDGQPNAEGYEGTAAEADIRGIVQEYTRKGMNIFAGAIGDDRPNIERIYKKGYLDMSDLQKLPYNLTRLIQQYLI